MSTADVLRKARYARVVADMRAIATELRAAPLDVHGIRLVTGEVTDALADSLDSWAALIETESDTNHNGG